MRFPQMKALALSLLLTMTGVNAAPPVGVMTLALNCPDRNTDPKCPNHVSQGQQQAQQQEAQRAKLQAQQQAQQQEAQRAKLQAQQAEQLRAKQFAAQEEQKRASLAAQQQEAQRAKIAAQQQEAQRAKIAAQQQDALRAKQLSAQQNQVQAKPLFHQDGQPNAKLFAAQVEQRRANIAAQQQEALRAKQFSAQQNQTQAKPLSHQDAQPGAKPFAAQEEQRRANIAAQQQEALRAKQFSAQQNQIQAKPLSHQDAQPGAKPFAAQEEQRRANIAAQQQEALRAKQFSAQQNQIQAKPLSHQDAQPGAKQFSAQQAQTQATQFSSPPDHRNDGLKSAPNASQVTTDRHRATPVSPVAVSAATKVVPLDDHKSFDIHHKNADGSQMVISHQLMPDGSKKVTGFKQTENSRDGTTTRIYSDGRRVTQGRDFERRSSASGTNFVTRRDGLREAVLPDGRPAFRDHFASYRDRDGSEHRMIERTRYTHWSHGRLEHDERPVVRQYDVANIYGAPVAHYRPSHFDPDYYRGFRRHFLAPVVVVAAAAAAWAAFATPATSYDDPVALMGDMQISSGFEEGYAESAPTGAIPLYDAPEAAEVRYQMTAVEQQVNTSVQGNASLKEQLAGVDVQAASSQVQQAVGNAMPVQIPEDVRQQVRQQVRLSIAMHQNGRSMILTDLLASGYANIYLFQTAQPINVAGVSNSECFLNTGDLIGFSTLPTTGSALAEMKVIASGSNSCRTGELVQVRLTELQEMLNGFSERVEDNMRRVSACADSRRC